MINNGAEHHSKYLCIVIIQMCIYDYCGSSCFIHVYNKTDSTTMKKIRSTVGEYMTPNNGIPGTRTSCTGALVHAPEQVRHDYDRNQVVK